MLLPINIYSIESVINNRTIQSNLRKTGVAFIYLYKVFEGRTAQSNSSGIVVTASDQTPVGVQVKSLILFPKSSFAE